MKNIYLLFHISNLGLANEEPHEALGRRADGA